MAGSSVIVITGVCAVISRSCKTHRLVGNDKMLGFALASVLSVSEVEGDGQRQMRLEVLFTPSSGLVFF